MQLFTTTSFSTYSTLPTPLYTYKRKVEELKQADYTVLKGEPCQITYIKTNKIADQKVIKIFGNTLFPDKYSGSQKSINDYFLKKDLVDVPIVNTQLFRFIGINRHTGDAGLVAENYLSDKHAFLQNKAFCNNELKSQAVNLLKKDSDSILYAVVLSAMKREYIIGFKEMIFDDV